MNVLLFAPALLQAYIATQGFMGTIKQLAICAIPQFILAAPFLAENPLSYMKGMFRISSFIYRDVPTTGCPRTNGSLFQGSTAQPPNHLAGK
jgi:hypothetical protein